MKKKLLILSLFIILSFVLGICINYFLSQKNTQEIITDPERLFNSNNIPAVSNSDPRGNKHIFKSFFAYDENINLENFNLTENMYYKKITSYLEYLEYKKLIPELRSLTKEDFINYYLIIVMSNTTDYIYMLNDIENNENTLNLELLKNKSLSQLPQIPKFSGVSIVLPNITEVPIENIKLDIAN